MKIFIAEKMAACGVAALEAAGHHIISKAVSGDTLREAVAAEAPGVLVYPHMLNISSPWVRGMGELTPRVLGSQLPPTPLPLPLPKGPPPNS